MAEAIEAIYARQLMDSAEESATWRGHSLTPFLGSGPHVWNARCRSCGKGVWVNTLPAPNEIDICGEAVALGCKD